MSRFFGFDLMKWKDYGIMEWDKMRIRPKKNEV